MTTTTTSPLPSRHAVRTLLEDLVGRNVEVRDAEPVPPKASNIVGVYVTDKLAVAALAVLNIEAGARLGGALAMLPRGVIDETISSKEMSPALRESCHEVLNVLSALFNVAGAPHVRLYEMRGPHGTIPQDVAVLSAAIGNRMDIQLGVAGFGTGQLSLVCR